MHAICRDSPTAAGPRTHPFIRGSLLGLEHEDGGIAEGTLGNLDARLFPIGTRGAAIRLARQSEAKVSEMGDVVCAAGASPAGIFGTRSALSGGGHGAAAADLAISCARYLIQVDAIVRITLLNK